jgi:hypothetical protein
MEHVGLCNFRSLHWRHVYHKRQLGQEDTDTSTHRQSHTDREVHVHPHESYQQVHWHASAKFTLINAKLVGCGRSVGGVSHYTAQEIQTCTPQIGTLYVCIESLLTLGALSLRSAHLGARALLAQTSLDSGFWNQVLHDYVGIGKALRAVSQVLGRSSTLFFLVDQFSVPRFVPQVSRNARRWDAQQYEALRFNASHISMGLQPSVSGVS